MRMFSICLAYGFGVSTDILTAIVYDRRATEESGEGTFVVDNLASYREVYGALSEKEKIGKLSGEVLLAKTKAYADSGNKRAQFRYATYLLNDKDHPDYETAFEYFQRAADPTPPEGYDPNSLAAQPYPMAKYYCALCLFFGRGTAKDIPTALEYATELINSRGALLRARASYLVSYIRAHDEANSEE
jgi:tetratricopeptide (TPR) repeat protein